MKTQREYAELADTFVSRGLYRTDLTASHRSHMMRAATVYALLSVSPSFGTSEKGDTDE